MKEEAKEEEEVEMEKANGASLVFDQRLSYNQIIMDTGP